MNHQWLLLFSYIISNQSVWGPLQNSFNIFSPSPLCIHGHCLSSDLHNLSLDYYNFHLFFRLQSLPFLIHPPNSPRVIVLSCKCDHIIALLEIIQRLPHPHPHLSLYNDFLLLSLVYTISLLALFYPYFSATS